MADVNANFIQEVVYTSEEMCKAHFQIADALKSGDFEVLDDQLRAALAATNFRLPVLVRETSIGDFCTGCNRPLKEMYKHCPHCGRPLDWNEEYFVWQQEWYKEEYDGHN